jgi:O-antigen ligase
MNIKNGVQLLVNPYTNLIGDFLIFLGICIYALLMPLGQFFREIGGILSLLGILWNYIFNFERANIKNYPFANFYFLFVGYLGFKTIHTINFDTSWYVFSMNIHKGFILFLAAIEFANCKKRLYLLCFLFAIAAFVQGCDGVYQYIYGVDFFKGTATWGSRLTGSLDSPRVGNYMAMSILPCLIIWELFRIKKEYIKGALLTLLIILPAVFLWYFAQSRSSYFGLVIAFVFLVILQRNLVLKKMFSIVASIPILFILLNDEQMTRLSRMFHDIRITQIWPAALEVFYSAPLLGVGNGCFKHGYQHLGITMTWQGSTVNYPHPHNIYLQLLAETGVVGFSLFFIFIFSTAIWTWKIIFNNMETRYREYFYPTSLLWVSFFGGYLVTALGAHSFFRTWWLGTSMILLGAVVGACAHFKKVRMSNCRLQGEN